LQYKEADSSTGDTTATMEFKNLATGDIIEKSISVGTPSTTTLSFGGTDYDVTSTSPSNAGTDDFSITVTGGVNGCVITENKAKICITDNGASATVEVTEADADMLEGNGMSVINFNVSAGSDIKLNYLGSNVNLISDPDDSDVETAISPYGAEYKYTTMSSSPNKIEISWPENQRLAQAFVTSGAIHTADTIGSGEIETSTLTRIEVGAAILDT
jgi:hypothetical protein